MLRQQNVGSESQSTSARNDLHEFFKGPKYLLIFKVPLLLIGAIIYMTYYIIKSMLVKSISTIYSAILSLPHLLEKLNFYLTILCDRAPEWVQYFAAKLYRNIITPIGIFISNHVFPTVYNGIRQIARKIVCQCVACYRSIVQPTAQLCYIYLIVRFPQWIDYVLITLHSNLSLLYSTMKFICLWIWTNILYPLYLWVCIDIPLWYYRTIIKMLSFIYNEVLPATYRVVRRTVHILRYWFNCLLLYINVGLRRVIRFICDSSTIVYRHLLLPLYQKIVSFILHINNKILKPVVRWITPIVKTVSYNIMKVVIRAIIYMSQAIIDLYHPLVSFSQTLIRICTFIYTVGPTVAYRFINRTVQALLHCLDCFIICLDWSLVKIIRFIYNVGQWTSRQMKIISYNLMKIIFYILIYSSSAIINSYNVLLLLCSQYVLRYYHILRRIYSFIHHEILPIVGRFAMRIVRTIWYGLERFSFYVRLGLLNIIRFVCNTSSIVYESVLLPLSRAVVRLFVYINNDVLKPVGQWIIPILNIISYYLKNIISNMITSAPHTILYCYHAIVYIYTQHLISLWDSFITMSSYIYDEILRLIKRLISFRYYELIFYPMICSVYEISEICYNSIIKPLGNVLSTLSSAIINICSAVMTIVYDVINTMHLTIVALFQATKNLFYYFIESRSFMSSKQE